MSHRRQEFVVGHFDKIDKILVGIGVGGNDGKLRITFGFEQLDKRQHGAFETDCLAHHLDISVLKGDERLDLRQTSGDISLPL